MELRKKDPRQRLFSASNGTKLIPLLPKNLGRFLMSYDVMTGFSVNKETTVFHPPRERGRTKYRARITHSVGGTSADIAFSMKNTFQREVMLIAGIGQDPSGPGRIYIQSHLVDAGIDLIFLPQKFGTSEAVVSIEEGESVSVGDPVIDGHKTEWMELPVDEVRRHVELCRPRIAIASGVISEEVPLVEALLSSNAEHRILNPREDLIRDPEAFPRVARCADTLFINHEELGGFHATRFAEDRVSREEIKPLFDLGPSTIIVTCNRHGAHYLDREGNYLFQPPIDFGEPIDKTGAGDSFLSGFVAGKLKGLPPKECLRWGATLAGLKILKIGGTTVPSMREFFDHLGVPTVTITIP